MTKQDIDKLLKAGKAVNKVVAVGEKVFKDDKIALDDLQYTPEMYNAISELVKAVKDYKEMFEEIKDIDAAEAIQFTQEIFF